MPFTLPDLPYAYDALQPHISAATLKQHHGAHHAGYVQKLNALVSGSELEGASLEAIVKRCAPGAPAGGPAARQVIFNNAAQAWNHAFFWNSLRPPVTGGAPLGALAERLEADFGGVRPFAEAFKNAAAGVFGSGWLWLVEDDGALAILATANADTPLVHGLRPLLVLDLWEHAYYLDHQSRRPAYVAGVVDHLLNWEFAERNFADEDRLATA